MTLSYKTLLVILAGLLGFGFGSVAFAFDFSTTRTPRCHDYDPIKYATYIDGGVECATVDACANADFTDWLGGSNVLIFNEGQSTETTRTYSIDEVASVTSNDYIYYNYTIDIVGSGSNTSETPSQQNKSRNTRPSKTCSDTPPDPEPDYCGELAGTEASFTTTDLYTIAGCVSGCLVSSSGGGRVQVQIEGADGTVYTSGNYTGAACSGDESQYSKVVDDDNPPYKMELINGVPTFTANGTTIKLASDNNGSAGNITSQMETLNPDLALDIKNSSGSTGVDGSPDESVNADTVLQVTNVNNVTNVNTSGYQVGYNSADPSGTGTGTGGETGGETGGDTVVNVDLSGVESRLDGIQETLDGIGEGVEFSGDEVGTFGSITSNFVAEVQGTGFIQAANNISFPTGAGTCPSFGVSVLGGNVSTTTHCEIWDSVKGVLSAIMLFVYAVFGIRTVMSA